MFTHPNTQKTWLESQEIHVLPWPAKSPDLSILENVREAMVRSVYARGRQIADVNGLLTEIQIA